MVTLLDSLRAQASQILAEVAAIPLDGLTDSNGQQIVVGHMADPVAAIGSSFVTMNTIWEYVDFRDHVDIDYADTYETKVSGQHQYHYVIVVGKNDEEVVIDFCARDIHPDNPFPLVMEAKEWRAYMGANEQGIPFPISEFSRYSLLTK